jgi:hypothetical protein
MRVRSKFATIMIVSFLGGLLAATGTQAAGAGVATSDYGFFSVIGNQYINFAQISTNTSVHDGTAYTVTGWVAPNIPPGYAASRGRLMLCGSDSVWREGNNTFNTAYDQPAVGQTSVWNAVGSAWWTRGVSYGWNGGGYNASYTYYTACQNS